MAWGNGAPPGSSVLGTSPRKYCHAMWHPGCSAYGWVVVPGGAGPPAEETMYSVTMMEGAVLGLAVVAITAGLLYGVLAGFPRALQTVTAGVTCPLVGRRVEAELVWDAWTVRCVDVRRCAVLGRCVDLCSRGCV